MTRRIGYCCLFVLLLLGFAALLVSMNLPSLISHVLTRVTGVDIRVKEARMGWTGGHLTVSLHNTELRGIVTGTVGACELHLPFHLKAAFKSVAITDFHVALADGDGKAEGIPLSIDHLSLSRGTVAYRGEKFHVEDLSADQLQPGKPTRLSASIFSGNGYGRLRVTGTGTYRGLESEGSGRFNLSAFDLVKLSDRLKGSGSLEGEFVCRQGRCTVSGPVAVQNLALKGHPFKKPLFAASVRGRITLLHEKESTEITAEDLSYRGTPVRLHLSVRKGDLLGLRITSGVFDLSLAREFLVEPPVSGGFVGLSSAVRGGRATIREIIYEAGKTLRGNLEVAQAILVYDGHTIDHVGATIAFEGERVRLSGAKGTFGNSSLKGFEGTAGLADGGTVHLRGRFDLDLEDMASFYDPGELRLNKGRSEGVLEIIREKGRPSALRMAGTIKDGHVGWRGLEAVAEGSYRIEGGQISFDPLVLSRGGSRLAATGSAGARSARGTVRGILQGDEIQRHLSLPVRLDGTLSLDMALEREGDTVKARGNILLNDLLVEIPKIFRKDQGVDSSITLSGNISPRGATMDEARIRLDAMDLDVAGTVDRERNMDLRISLEIQRLQRLGRFFFLDEETAEGDARMRLSVKGLRFPMKRLPFVTGQVRVRNGTLRLPFLSRSMRDITLAADFRGDTFDVALRRLICGTTRINQGLLRVEGLEKPRFSLSLDFEHLRLGDFQGDGEFVMRPPQGGTILAHAEGDLTITAGTFDLFDFAGTEGSLSAHLRERRLSIPRLKGRLFGGPSVLEGMVDLSGSEPVVQASARLHDVDNNRFLNALGARSQVIEGPATIVGSFETTGTTLTAMVESMDGNAVVYSRNGVIKRWNLLSKVFGLLNLYDLVRGRINFGREGLPYRKLGGSFKIEKGVISSSDFIIDSPSMFISMDGRIDAREKTLQGNVAVSPLVALDTTIGRIPILRNILKGDKKGFLYAAYTVKGPIDDPDISVDLVNTIGGKTLEILRNILVLPAEVFK